VSQLLTEVFASSSTFSMDISLIDQCATFTVGADAWMALLNDSSGFNSRLRRERMTIVFFEHCSKSIP